MKKIVNFSGGRSSAYLVNWLQTKQPDNYIYIFANTSKETPETYNFIKNCNNYFNLNLIVVEHKKGSFFETDIDNCKKNGEIFENVINEKKIIPNIAWRYCTETMKITPTKRYLKSKGIKQYVNYLGIRVDEPIRYSKIMSRNSKNVYNDMPLFYDNINKKMVDEFWQNMPFDLEHNSIFGNCDLCFMKGKNKLINILREKPNLADWWIKQEKKVNNTFIKDYSYSTLLKLSKQPQFNFNDEIEIICNCNPNE